MSFITNIFKKPKPRPAPVITTPSVKAEPSSDPEPVRKAKRGARLALFQTAGGAFGVTGNTPTARRKLLGN